MATENNNINEEVVEKPKKATHKKKVVKEEVVEEKLTITQKRKILKDSEVVIINNIGAFVFYKDDNLGVEIELPSYADQDIVEMEVIRRMAMKAKGFFENYWILVTDFICDDDRIGIEDVYDYLGISKYYKGMEELPSGDFFDDLLLNDSIKNFKKYVNTLNPRMMTQLCNRAMALYTQGRFDSSQKIDVIEEKVDREGLFQDLKIED
jgi:hypothetical protein